MEVAPGHHADALTPAESPEDSAIQSQASGALLARMRQEGFRFDFYQAVRLLELRSARAAAADGYAPADVPRIRFRTSTSLSFPASDIRRILVPDSADEEPTVVSTFMGLYGVDSPLPEYFYERIAIDEGSALELRDFLDIFAHRFYAFFYRAWKRVRPELDAAGTHARRFLALGGLAHAPTDAGQPVSPFTMLPLAGRLAPRARGAEGLTSMLRTLLDLPVRIEQFIPRWVRIDRAAGIGRGARLAGSAMLGERIFDVSGKFRLWIGPMNLERYLALLPGGPDARVLNWVVRAHLPGYLDHDVALQLYTEGLPPICLGDGRSRLGLTTCLGKPAVNILTRIVKQS